MGVPKVDRAGWRLLITGMVERDVDLSLADLAAMPQVEVQASHDNRLGLGRRSDRAGRSQPR